MPLREVAPNPTSALAPSFPDSHGSRLKALTDIVQEVDSAPDMEAALRIVVRRTREVMEADVCTVYFTEEARRRHVIVATDGLSSEVVGHVQFGFGRGLIGLVANSRRSVNLDQVPAELDQGFVLQAGAGPYHGFLGVPMPHKGQVQGVLVVRQREARKFDDADEAFLTTLAAQLGSAIAYAKASGELCRLCRPEDKQPHLLEGLAAAPGIAAGTGVVLFGATGLDEIPDRRVEDPAAEVARFRDAVAAVRAEITRLGQELAGTLSCADQALFDAYALMLDSPELVDSTAERILKGNWAPGALRQAIDANTKRFKAMDDAYLRERAADVRQLGSRILTHLQGAAPSIRACPPDTVLIGRQLSAIDLGLVPNGRLRGLLSAKGSSLSHAAILARALGIPAVMGVGDLPLALLDGQEILLDGDRGRVYVRPDPALRHAFDELISEERALSAELEPLRLFPAVTKDGVEVPVYINTVLSADVAGAAGSAGVGLFRSELPFLFYDRLPSEQEQFQVYRQVLEAMVPLPVNLRTLDVGGDKPLPYMPIEEPNPALGWRGMRFALDHPEIFVTQLRAALRAAIGLGNLRLLLPMVSDVDEVEQALAFVHQAHCELAQEGLDVSLPPVGLMIEVPAAVYQAPTLARKVDFFSVGTNDLAQYLLAIDRNNPQVSKRLEPLHPAMLAALAQVVEAARCAGKPVTVCGEMAGQPAATLLLVGMGFDGLSVNAAFLPQVKRVIRSMTLATMRSIAQQALALDRSERVRSLLEQALAEAGLARLIRTAGTQVQQAQGRKRS